MSDDKPSWLSRLKSGLSRTTAALTEGINDRFRKRKLDSEALEELEEILITADLGVATAARLTQKFGSTRFDQEVTSEEIRGVLASDIAEILAPVAVPLTISGDHHPFVILVCGVNGSGKTTTIGKLAQSFKDDGKSVYLAACDTFRAAAVEQLKIWGDRTGVPVISKDQGADSAGLAFDALQQARSAGADVLLIDTAGRLQNKSELMSELEKIVRVVRKIDESAPHSRLLVLDATVGQNAHSQVEVFANVVDISGLVMTKLDGSAKGGVVVALAERFGLPIHAVGVGEQAEDLRPFEATAFARALMDVEPEA